MNIIISCAVIWNFLRNHNYELEYDEEDDIQEDTFTTIIGNESSNSANVRAQVQRNLFIRNYFSINN